MDIRYLKKIEKRLAERTIVNSFDRGTDYYDHLIKRGYTPEEIESDEHFWTHWSDYDRSLPSCIKVWGYRRLPDYDEVNQSIRRVAMEYIHKQWVYRRLKNAKKRSKGLVFGRKKEF